MIYWQTNIRHIRKLYGYTITRTAEAIGVTPQAYGSWEERGIRPQLDTYVKVSNAFKLSIHVLILADLSKVKTKEGLRRQTPTWRDVQKSLKQIV